MKSYKLSISCLLALSFIAIPVFADIYKCVNSEGKTTFKQFPCDNNNDAEIIVQSSTSTVGPENINSENNTIITKNQLIGSWSDFNKKSKYASTWTFSDSNMTLRKHNGRVIKLNYTLENNILIIHHKKNIINDKDWDEELVIIKYEGKRLVWKWGVTPVTLYRL